MKLVIPSINRWNKQPTLEEIPLSQTVCLVVPSAQKLLYRKYSTNNTYICEHPNELKNIGEVRHWILEQFYPEPVVMLDDDLEFFVRRIGDLTKFRKTTVADVAALVLDLEEQLTKYPHVAVATREGGNRITDDYVYNTRGLRVLGYNTQIVLDEGVQFNRLAVMEDFDITLQLLRKGHPNCIINWMVHNQGGSGSAGGCSTYRTLDMQAQAAHRLKELHPEFVTVVEKTTKTAWGGATRTDVRIQWKKAYESAKR